MQANEPHFDIFKGVPDKNAVWVERVEGLAAARRRMEELAKERPGSYFVFSPVSHAVLAKQNARGSAGILAHGYNVVCKLRDGSVVKVAWRRDEQQAKELIDSLMEFWPGTYLIQSAVLGADAESEPPAATA